LDLPDWALRLVSASVVLFGVVFVVFLVMVRYPTRVRGLTELLFGWLPGRYRYWVETVQQQFVEGLGAMGSWRSLGVILLLSFLAWGVEVVFYYFSAMSFGISISLLDAAFLMGILNLGIMIPAAPGGLGTFEFITVRSLALYGVGGSLAFSYGLVSHLIQNGSIVLIGLIFLWQMGISLSSLQEQVGFQEGTKDNVSEN